MDIPMTRTPIVKSMRSQRQLWRHPLLVGAMAAVLNLVQPAWWVAQPADGMAHAQSSLATSTFTVTKARPEAFSWCWDNIDSPLFKAAHSDNRTFQWLQAPATPEHLGYSAGARYRASVLLAGKVRTVEVTYLPYQSVQTRVATDNFLGNKPYSFVAQKVSIDGQAPFDVLVQYTPTGRTHADTQFNVAVISPADGALQSAYVTHLTRTLQGLSPRLMKALDERYFNAVLKKRGSYTIGQVDDKLNVTLTVEQDIKGITTEMLDWWWDHIGDTARYRLWQPIDHVTFEWEVAPTHPDLQYDIGAKQKVKEYIGPWAMTLDITGADPLVKPPPVSTGTGNFFYADADLSLLAGILPSNKLVHRWRSNAAGDGVLLTSTFVNTSLARVINVDFFDDLGSHALREFQMLPYFLPRLYRREHLGQ